MDVQLNFINNSNDVNNSDVIIFQKNEATDFDELSVAWMVIKYCGFGDNHPFTFPMSMTVGASDSYGNHTPKIGAEYGKAYSMQLTSSGEKLVAAGNGTSAKAVQVRNDLMKGTINASIYKNGKLLATKTSITRDRPAVFEFKPTIWIGVASQIMQGEVMNSAITYNINTELSLLGIASADIVMTGGGRGPDSTPFQFNLENIVYA